MVMRGRKTTLAIIGVIAVVAAILLSQTESEYEASFSTTIEFLSGIISDVDRVGLIATRVSSEKEMKIGEEIHSTIKIQGLSGGRVHAHRLSDYVSDVGRLLLMNVNRDGIQYRFTVLRSSQINAFAVAGGYIYITTGMLDFSRV